MRFTLLLLVAFFFYGCGSSSKSEITVNENLTNNTSSIFNQQWYLQKDTDFYAKHNIDADAHIHPDIDTYQKYTGAGVKIAIIDDGFDVNHPEIKDKIIATISVKDDGSVVSDVTHTNATEYHGTAVAGIIGSNDDGVNVRGVAPNAGLILIKMPDLLPDSVLIKLFDEAVNNGADIINCSWGTGDVSQTVRDHINLLASTGRNGKGVIIVFASGNDNALINNDESGIENVIGVGATDGDNLRTSYSNYGATLDIVAPGGYYNSIATIDPIGISGASHNNYNEYNQMENGKEIGFIGTSASAPVLSGAIALLLEKYPNLTREEVQEKLKTTTDTIGQNTPYMYDVISSNSQTPTIIGLLGTSGNNAFKVRLISKDTNSVYGPFDVTKTANNRWESQATTSIPYGNYKIEAVSSLSNDVIATDDNFIIGSTLSNDTDMTKLKSDFYGYGKINLTKLLQ